MLSGSRLFEHGGRCLGAGREGNLRGVWVICVDVVCNRRESLGLLRCHFVNLALSNTGHISNDNHITTAGMKLHPMSNSVSDLGFRSSRLQAAQRGWVGKGKQVGFVRRGKAGAASMRGSLLQPTSIK